MSWSINKESINHTTTKSRRCSLCLNEKLEIVDDPDEIQLTLENSNHQGTKKIVPVFEKWA